MILQLQELQSKFFGFVLVFSVYSPDTCVSKTSSKLYSQDKNIKLQILSLETSSSGLYLYTCEVQWLKQDKSRGKCGIRREPS
jgi:hypothetical protein